MRWTSTWILLVNSSANNKVPRKFYLTRTTHNGAQALSACAGGYHMASPWEIFDTSNLRYDTELGFTTVDSGFGPPTLEYGWIRTGGNARVVPTPGRANCNMWTNAGGMEAGTVVLLSDSWGLDPDSPVSRVSPWAAAAGGYIAPRPVWCVQD